MEKSPATLGPFLATMLVAGAMIGSGIYLIPASLGTVGSIAILSWIAATICAALLAASFSALAILRPETPGLFSYIRNELGSSTGFVIGVIYWFAQWVGNVPIALAVTGYLSIFIPGLANPFHSQIATNIVMWLFILANIAGPKFVARYAGWVLLIGLAPIILVAFGGWFYFHPSIFLASWNVSGQSAYHIVPATMVTVFWGFIGIENASVLAPLVKNPARNVPIATIAGLLIAAILYMLASTVIMGILPASALAKSTAPFADAALPIVGTSIAGLIAICAMLKASGSLGVGVLLTVETAESEAVLGQILRRPGHRPGAKSSTTDLILTGLLMSATLYASTRPTLARQFTILIDVSVILSLIAYIAGCAALFRITYSIPAAQRRKIQALAFAAAAFSAWLIVTSEREVLIYSAVLIALSFAAYLPLKFRAPALAAKPAD